MGGGKLGNKGFAISGMIYPILILTIFLIVSLLTTLQSRKEVLDYNKKQLLDDINKSNEIYDLETLTELVKKQQETIDEINNKYSKLYPVGSVYVSVKNQSPSTFLGGTWETFGTGKTLVGVDTSQSEFNSVEKTGGEKTHTLSEEEMPKHEHGVGLYFTGYAEWDNTVSKNNYVFNYNSTVIRNLAMESVEKTATASSGLTYKTGGSKPHNNLQPYITVYMWKRIA